MYGIFDAKTGELLEGGFFRRAAAEDAAREYIWRGIKVIIRKQS
jgi:hypothetical protein